MADTVTSLKAPSQSLSKIAATKRLYPRQLSRNDIEQIKMMEQIEQIRQQEAELQSKQSTVGNTIDITTVNNTTIIILIILIIFMISTSLGFVVVFKVK
jgi:hypothetical protein